MAQAFALLLLCQFVGESAVRLLGLTVPGPVLGLLLLAAGLLIRNRLVGPDAPSVNEIPVGVAANGLLAHFSLLFVPAGVGIIQQGGLVLNNGVALIAAIVISTALSLVVTAYVFLAVARLTRREDRR
jgi:putative effector of murein hydrolase LrgA (UPF0299 family)